MSKIFNDPIHGTITLHPLLIKIIDTPQFQRLRNIKQLGGCYFVYPSASHNRFEHSIGTCFLASKLARQLQAQLKEEKMNLTKDKELLNDMKKLYLERLGDATMKKEDILCIEIAGLCHDIGHGPYSHLFDRLFNKAIKKKHQETTEWEHEDVSGKMLDFMIENNPDLKQEFVKIFGDLGPTMQFIKDLIKGKTTNTEEKKARSYMYEIIANKRNEIDVDKMDYFARDCHGLGMKSNFDHLRFISQCRVMLLKSDDPDETTIAVRDNDPDETTIAVRDKEEYNLYEFFHTRIGLFRRAYYHSVNKAIELMLTDALVAANDHLDIPIDTLPDAHEANDHLDIPTDRLTDALEANDHLDIPTDRLTDAPEANDHLDIPTDSGGTVKMSQAYKHMSAYEKLTDSIVDVILMSTKEELKEAKDLINRIYERQLYKLVGRTTPKQELTEKEFSDIGKNLLQNEKGFKKDDFRVQKLSFSYGKGTENPIKHVYFYEKGSYECFKGKDSKKTSLLLPSENFQEDVAFIYSTSIDKETTDNIKRKWKEIQNTD